MKSLFLTIKAFILLLILLISTNSQAHQTIYIDPDHKGKMNGSIEFPFNSWDSITVTDGNIYLQKSGTTFFTESGIKISSKKNVTIGAYGNGGKPKIIGTGDENTKVIDISNSQNFIITNLDVSSITGHVIAGIIIDGKDSRNNLITDCTISNVQWGIRVITKASGNRILNCIIYNTQDDGVYLKDVQDIEIGYCKIYNVNLKYLVNKDNDFATGDNIQIASNNNLHFNIHHNHLDHSYTGNKFCLIVWGENYTGKVEYNTFIGNSYQVSSGIYLSPTTEIVTIGYNTFSRGNYAIYSMAKDIKVYYNAFIENNIAISIQDNSNLTVQNNTFYINKKFSIYSKRNTLVTSQNNIFHSEADAFPYQIEGELISDYNFYSGSDKTMINASSSLSNWQKSIGMDSNSLSGNPKFANPNKYDLSLSEDSPCIDKGINLGLDKDFYGTPLISDSKVDIGFHEFAR